MDLTWKRHLTTRWPDEEQSCWYHADPTSKVALGRCGLPTLVPRSECGLPTLCPRGPNISMLSGCETQLVQFVPQYHKQHGRAMNRGHKQTYLTIMTSAKTSTRFHTGGCSSSNTVQNSSFFFSFFQNCGAPVEHSRTLTTMNTRGRVGHLIYGYSIWQPSSSKILRAMVRQ